MFYLVPALSPYISRLFNSEDKPADAEKAETQKGLTQRKWSKADIVGLLIDISLVAGLSILAGLTLLAALNVPVGPLNALAALKVPGAIGFALPAMAIITIDVLKIIYKLCCLKEEKAQKHTPDDDNFETIHKPRDGNGQPQLSLNTKKKRDAGNNKKTKEEIKAEQRKIAKGKEKIPEAVELKKNAKNKKRVKTEKKDRKDKIELTRKKKPKQATPTPSTNSTTAPVTTNSSSKPTSGSSDTQQNLTFNIPSTQPSLKGGLWSASGLFGDDDDQNFTLPPNTSIKGTNPFGTQQPSSSHTGLMGSSALASEGGVSMPTPPSSPLAASSMTSTIPLSTRVTNLTDSVNADNTHPLVEQSKDKEIIEESFEESSIKKTDQNMLASVYMDEQDDFMEIDGLADQEGFVDLGSKVQYPKTTWWDTGAYLMGAVGRAVGYGIVTAADLVANCVKHFFKPGSIQMHFYALHTNFMVEQMYAYNEGSATFDPIRTHLDPKGKLAQLLGKKFKNSEIEAFKNKMLHIIKENEGHPFTTRSSLLMLIEDEKKTLNTKTPEFQKFLQKYCFQIYTKFDALSYGRMIIDTQLAPYNDLSFESLPAVLKDDQACIEHLGPKLCGTALRGNRERVRGASGVAFWPMLTNNFASRLWTESYNIKGTSHKVEVIRFGSPTEQNIGSAEILGQMELFVKECTAKEKTILSFQHQTFKGESARLEAMFTLAANNPQSLFCMNLDMDSEFYHQKRKGVDINETTGKSGLEIKYEEFQASLVEHMLTLEMSDNLKTKIAGIKGYKDDLKAIADDVKAQYFPGTGDTLTRQERQDFIMLFYARYRQYLHAQIQPNYSCHQCKDTMDRSMTLAALSYLVNLIDLGHHKDTEQLSIFRTLVSFAGIIIKGSPVHHGRFERFLPVVDRLTQLKQPPQCQTAFVHSQSIHQPSFNQTFYPLPCEAKTAKEYEDSHYMQSNSSSESSSTAKHEELLMRLPEGQDPKKVIQQMYHKNNLDGRDYKAEFTQSQDDVDRFEVSASMGSKEKKILAQGTIILDKNNALSISIKRIASTTAANTTK